MEVSERPVLDDEKLKLAADSMLREYFAQRDKRECCACIAEINRTQRNEYCVLVVNRALDTSLDKGESERVAVQELLVHLHKSGAPDCHACSVKYQIQCFLPNFLQCVALP